MHITQCELNGARSCAHARKTIPLAPIHLFGTKMQAGRCDQKFDISWAQEVTWSKNF